MENQLRSARSTRPTSAIALSRRSTFHQIIVKQGYLVKLPKCSKLGSSFKKPERLWFVFGNLNRNIPFLDYYLNEERIFSGVPDGSVEIRDCLYVLPSQKHPASSDYVFTIVLKDKRLSLATKTRTLMHEWCRAIEQNLRHLGILDSIGGNNVYSLVTIKKSKPQEQESRSRVPTPEIELQNEPELDDEENSHDYENTKDNWEMTYISMSPRVYSNIANESRGPRHSSLDSSNEGNSPDEYILPNTPIRLTEPFSLVPYSSFAAEDRAASNVGDHIMTPGMDSPDIDESRRNEILFSIESNSLYFTETVDRKTVKEKIQNEKTNGVAPSASDDETILKYVIYPKSTKADNANNSINLLRKFPHCRVGFSQKSFSAIGCENFTNIPPEFNNDRQTGLQRPITNGDGAGMNAVHNTASSSVLLTSQTILKNHMSDINLGSNMIVTSLRRVQEIELKNSLELLICQPFKIHKLLNLVEAYNSLWIAGWNEQLMTKLFIPMNFFHVGDQLISVNDVEINTTTNYLKIFKKLKNSKKNFIKILRTPHAKVVLIKHKFNVLPSSTAMLLREFGLDTFGDHMQVKNILPGGIVSQCDLPVKAPNLNCQNVCDWCVTEINHRNINSFAEAGKVEEELKLREPFTSLLLQPSDLVSKLNLE